MSEPAAEALVNLSQVPDLAGKMVEMSVIKIVMDILYKIDCDIKHLLVMLIVNITQLDAGIEALLQVAFIISFCLFLFLYFIVLRHTKLIQLVLDVAK